MTVRVECEVQGRNHAKNENLFPGWERIRGAERAESRPVRPATNNRCQKKTSGRFREPSLGVNPSKCRGTWEVCVCLRSNANEMAQRLQVVGVLLVNSVNFLRKYRSTCFPADLEPSPLLPWFPYPTWLRSLYLGFVGPFIRIFAIKRTNDSFHATTLFSNQYAPRGIYFYHDSTLKEIFTEVGMEFVGCLSCKYLT